MIINIDIDNTLNNFLPYFLIKLNDLRINSKRVFVEDDFTDYDICKVTNIQPNTLETMFFHNNEFYDNLLPLFNSVNCIQQLHEEGNIIKFVTSRDYEVLPSTIRFVDTFFPFLDVNDCLVFSKQKELLWADVVIDDCLCYLINVNPECVFMLKNCPWNKHTSRCNFTRFDDWSEFPNIFDQMINKERSKELISVTKG